MRVLALNPFYGGSHRAFLDGWIAHSRHEFDVLTLPAYKWKWRMRHAAITFAEELKTGDDIRMPDVLFCTDMLNLAEFRGLCPRWVRDLPAVAYFHENQLTYPSDGDDRDLHFGFTNLTTALCADSVWWNSAFHRDSFLQAAGELVDRMPDFRPSFAIEQIAEKSRVLHPGIEPVGICEDDSPVADDLPLRIVWVSRWEHDKNPETFFAALRILTERDVRFRVSVLGESFGRQPECFATARLQLGDRVASWGFLESADDYHQVLRKSDVVVSTARHEFFGIGVVEAVSAGCFPCMPRRLAYPEVLGDEPAYFHDGTANGLAERFEQLASFDELRKIRASKPERAAAMADRFGWKTTAASLGDALEAVVR